MNTRVTLESAFAILKRVLLCCWPVHQPLFSASKKNRICEKKTPNLRLAKRQKTKFTRVNEYFCCERNEKIGVSLQRFFVLVFLCVQVSSVFPFFNSIWVTQAG
jgi:hypothetical protein